jgi:pimeloyl-ACP methyl ester carboxylesterase
MILRFIFTLISLAILIAAGYLLWTWYDGRDFIDEAGVVHRIRDDWRLWVGIALMAWSFVGKFLCAPLLARPDRGELSDPTHGQGEVVEVAGGSRLYIEASGPASGQPLILIHGAGMDSTIWSYAKRHFRGRHRVVVWDLPGLGRSQPTGTIDLDTYAESLRIVLSGVGGRPAIVAGHSMGGMIIQTLARNHPELFGREIAGVVLINTTFTNPLKTMILPRLAQALQPLIELMCLVQAAVQPLSWLTAWQSYLSGSAHMAMRLGFGPEVTRSQLDHATLLSTRNPPASLARGNIAMFHWDATGALAGLPIPVLVLGGGIDIVTKEEASRVIAAEAPNARLQIIERANHMGFLEQHATYNAAITTFAETVSTGR